MTSFWKEYQVFLKSPQWRMIREKVFATYGKRCHCCKSYKTIQVHHLTYKNWQSPAMSDLVPLCKHCHDQLTRQGRQHRLKGHALLNAHKGVCKARRRNLGLGSR